MFDYASGLRVLGRKFPNPNEKKQTCPRIVDGKAGKPAVMECPGFNVFKAIFKSIELALNDKKLIGCESKEAKKRGLGIGDVGTADCLQYVTAVIAAGYDHPSTKVYHDQILKFSDGDILANYLQEKLCWKTVHYNPDISNPRHTSELRYNKKKGKSNSLSWNASEIAKSGIYQPGVSENEQKISGAITNYLLWEGFDDVKTCLLYTSDAADE